MSETFGQRLSRLRKEKGLTQEDIAKRIIISPQAVSKWENDISSPDILVLSSLADILGVSVDVLLGREESEETTEESKSEKVEAEVVNDDEKFAEEETKEEIRRDSEGVHIVDKKGRRVDIDDDGIRITDENGTRKPNISKEIKDGCIFGGIIFGLALIGFILMGILWEDQSMGWKTGWILFLIAIVISSIPNAIRHKKITHFAYPVLVVATYCALGFLGMYFNFEGWGFYWFLFLTIPAFYLIFGSIDKYIHRNDPPRLNDDDDDEDDD